MSSGAALNRASRADWASSGYFPSRRRLRGWATGILCCSAKAFTGLGRNCMPRPEGRSGWVRTRGISCPAASRDSSAVRANSGVPAKTMRMSGADGFAFLLAQLGANSVLFQRRQVFDKHLAHEVVHFVLDADRQKPVGVEFVGFAVFIQRTYADAGGTFNFVVDARDRQTAFLVNLKVVAFPDDLRVDEHAQVIALFGDIDNDNAFMDINLSGSQPHTRRVIHGLGHVTIQLADAVIDLADGFGHLEQAWVRISKDG